MKPELETLESRDCPATSLTVDPTLIATVQSMGQGSDLAAILASNLPLASLALRASDGTYRVGIATDLGYTLQGSDGETVWDRGEAFACFDMVSTNGVDWTMQSYCPENTLDELDHLIVDRPVVALVPAQPVQPTKKKAPVKHAPPPKPHGFALVKLPGKRR